MNLLTQRRPSKLVLDRGLSSATWRRVPRINMLPQKPRTVTPLLAGLGLVFVIAIALLLLIYNGLSKANSDLDNKNGTLDLLAAQMSNAEGIDASLDNQINGVTAQITALTAAEGEQAAIVAELHGNRIDWTVSLFALLQADSLDIRFRRVDTMPDGTILVTGAATDVASMNRLQEHLLSLNELIDIVSGPSWKQGEYEMLFTFEVKVR